MTLGGLALAIGILVDEGVVLIENIDHTLEREPNLPVARGVLQATQLTIVSSISGITVDRRRVSCRHF